MSRISKRALFESQPLDPFLTELSQHKYHAFLRGAQQLVYLRLVALLRAQLPAGARVLDWGAGKGQVTYLLKKAGYDVVSVETQEPEDGLGVLFKDGTLPLTVLKDPVALPFTDAEFDAVLSFGVLEHVPQDAASMVEIARVLKPGGRLFIFYLPNHLGWINHLAHLRGIHYHDRLYSMGRLRELARGAGLNIESAWYGQLFPKNTVHLPAGVLNGLEFVDRCLTEYTPLRYFATNLEAVLSKP